LIAVSVSLLVPGVSILVPDVRLSWQILILRTQYESTPPVSANQATPRGGSERIS